MITKANFNYSLKNVPIPSQTTHLRGVIASTEKFIQNARWKCFYHLNPKPSNPNKVPINTFGFKSPKCAPLVNELIPFEKDLSNLISSFEYSEYKSSFQKQLQKDVNRINKSKNVFILADKTSNVYELDPNTYKQLKNNNILPTYKKTDIETVNNINREAKHLTQQLQIDNRVEIIADKEAYVTIKDHKADFPNNIKCRLINPCKSNVGLITKQILDKINLEIKTRLNLNQLLNTSAAINWFKNITNKKDKSLILIDLVDYYPSITEDLFNKAITFAENITSISTLEKDLLLNARKSVLYHDDAVWTKTSGLFDVTMGSYDGAQITDLVGLMLLSKMKDKFPEINFSLYRDDGLGYHKKMTNQKLDRLRKSLHNFFASFGLKITIETGLQTVNFLDVTFDLCNNTFQPYRKPNDNPLYIHKDSNHPKHIINNIPKAINKRLTEISSSPVLFENSKGIYQNALNLSGYKYNLKYENSNNSAPLNSSPPTPTLPPTTTPIVNPNPNLDNMHLTPPNSTPANTPPSTTTPTVSSNSNPDNVHPPTSPVAMSQPRRSQRIRAQQHATSTADYRRPTASTNNNDNMTATQVDPPPTEPRPTNLTPPKKSKKSNKNILWYNPTFSLSLTTPFGRSFLQLLDKHFPVNHPLYPVMNRKKCKISYSCPPSMLSIINAHNKKILMKNKPKPQPPPCNCKTCPIPDSNCRTKSVIYSAKIENATYYGLTSLELKDRIISHRQTFRTETKKNATALSSYIWTNEINRNRDNNEITEPKIKWAIEKTCRTYKPGDKNCDLCLSEKVIIVQNINNPKTINKKTDCGTTCVHRRNFFLSGVT